MLSISQAEQRAAALVEAARKAGADAADVLYCGDASTSVQVRLGGLEDVQRSEGEEIGLRFFTGRRSATVSSSDLSKDALAALVDRAAAMAREAPEDPYAGLAPPDRLLKGSGPEVDGDDDCDPLPTELKARALAMEEVARAAKGITNSDGASASAGRSVIALATSDGFCRGYTTSGYNATIGVIAGNGGGMQRDWASHSARHFADLDGPEALGRLAAERALAKLDPGKLPSGAMPVLFDPRVGSSLIGHLLGAITGGMIARKTSFLLDRIGDALFPPNVTVRDDPHRTRGLRSRPFDGEGVATQPLDIIADGRLTGWLLDSASARQLELAPTGHATRGVGGAPGSGATNVDLLPGTIGKEALIRETGNGVYVTELIGHGVNLVTGDFSRGASGFIIRNGELTTPVAEITIAGNLSDMFARLTAADDLEHRRVANVPTLRVDGMTVAGA
ncbi:MAG TPA: TldD/PmbA family protein [Allosphingosinicella sp.]|nr:TldD/PmbA family protein [Allosphingosinicella sp.]